MIRNHKSRDYHIQKVKVTKIIFVEFNVNFQNSTYAKKNSDLGYFLIDLYTVVTEMTNTPGGVARYTHFHSVNKTL